MKIIQNYKPSYKEMFSLDIIKVTFEKNETFWSNIQREEFLEKYNCKKVGAKHSCF